MIEKDLFIALQNVTQRVYPMKMPDDALFPLIVYTVVSDNTNQATNGNYSSRNVRVQVDVYSTSYSEAKTLKDGVVNEVIGLKGGSISAQDLYEDETSLFRELIDITFKRN